MPVNIELLAKIKNHIERFPQACDQEYFEITIDKAAKESHAIGQWDGKARCIGGHAIALSGGKIVKNKDSGGDRNWNLARARLGLSADETDQLLCFDHANIHGPYEDLRDDLLRANIGTPEYAAVVIKAIDRCITRHSPKPDAIDLEVNAVCASVRSEIKSKGLLTRDLTKKESAVALVGAAMFVVGVLGFVI